MTDIEGGPAPVTGPWSAPTPTLNWSSPLLGASGLIRAELFAIGLSSGIRVIGSVAIAGCLLSAIGYGYIDYLEK